MHPACAWIGRDGNRLGDAVALREAIGFFRQSGAKVDLAFALHALARMAVTEADGTEAALQRYGQAIVVPDAVKAEYPLGRACRERAEIITKLGQLPKAQADLVRARQCYAAVEADAEKIEVDNLALTLRSIQRLLRQMTTAFEDFVTKKVGHSLTHTRR